MAVASRNRKRLPLSRAAKHRIEEEIEPVSKKKANRFDGMSPNTKRHEKPYIHFCADEAYKDLLTLRARNGGKPRFSDIRHVCDSYIKSKKRAKIDRWHLEYQIKMAKRGKHVKGPNPKPPPIDVTPTNVPPETEPQPQLQTTTNDAPPSKNVQFNIDEPTQTSGLTNVTCNSSATNESNLYNCNFTTNEDPFEEEIEMTITKVHENDNITTTSVFKRKGGRPKDSSLRAQDNREMRRKQVLTVAATHCLQV
jgi:hypothetical protein